MEIEEPTNRYFIHPIAARLAVLCAKWGIKPNTVSIAGMACGILAGFAYYHYRNHAAAVLGFCLMIAWHVMDGADGQLARLTNAQSEFGKLLDGICDYVTFIVVYSALGFAMAGQHGAIVLPVVALAGICHAVQSAAYEAQRQDYLFWGWGRGAGPAATSNQANGLLGAYSRVQIWLSNAAFNQALFAIFIANPASIETIRTRYRARFAPGLRHWSILSANYRTLGIFLCAWFRMPLLYFVFEIIGFTAILVILAKCQNDRHAAFIADAKA